MVGGECEFEVGQLVEYRAWYDGDGAWISIENQVGIVLEIITITDSDFSHTEKNIIIYDVKVYWIDPGVIETVPDLLLANYGEEHTEFV